MIQLIPSLRTALFRRYYLLKNDSDVKLGYFLYPRITGSPSEIVYRAFDNTLAVFSSVDNEIALVDPDNKRVYSRVKNAGNPVSPGVYFPEIDGIVYRGDGGIDSDGVYILTKNNELVTLAAIADGTVGEISHGLYNPTDKAVYLLDIDRAVFHRINTDSELQTNFLSLPQASNGIQGITYSPEKNSIYLADRENRQIQYIINPSSPTKGSFSTPTDPYGVAWSSWDQSLYVSGLFSTNIYRYSQQGETFTETANSSNLVFNGTITDAVFDSIRQRVYLKVTSGLLNRDQLIYLQPNLGNLFRMGSLFLSLEDQTTNAVPEKLRLYTTDSKANTIRSYPIHQTIVDQRVIGTQGSIVSALYFTGNEGLIVLEGLTATVFDRTLGVRTVGFSLLDNYSSYVSSGDKVLEAQWLDNEGEQLLLLAFDNSTVLAVNDAFSVLAQIPIEDIVFTVNGTDILVNPNVNGPYEIVEFAYNRSFQHLFVAIANGTTDISDHQSGLVLVFDISEGVSNLQPIAFTEMPQSINRLKSIAINTSANYLLAIGDSTNNSIFRAFDAVPSGSELILLSSKTASLGVGNLTVFKGRAVFASENDSTVYNLGKALAANFDKSELIGGLTTVDKTEKHGFVFVLDPPNNRIFVLNSLYNLYATLYTSGTPKDLVYFQDSLYVVYQGTDQVLPSLANTITGGQETNLLTFSSSIGIKIDVGDVVTITQNQTYYVVSLSQVEPSDTKVYVETFTPSSNLDPTSTEVKLTGDIIARINQEPIQKQVSGSTVAVESNFTLATGLNSYYSLSYRPYLVTNSSVDIRLQSIQGEFTVLGDPFSDRLGSLYSQNGSYLYVVGIDGTFYRIHILQRWVQTIVLGGGPNTSNLKDFVIVSDSIYVLFNNDSNIYSYSLSQETGSNLTYQLSDSLTLNETPSQVSYSELDDLIRIYTSNFNLILVKP